jgi:hypothetical protein
METEEDNITTNSTPERQTTGRDNIWANIQTFVFFPPFFHILTSWYTADATKSEENQTTSRRTENYHIQRASKLQEFFRCVYKRRK